MSNMRMVRNHGMWTGMEMSSRTMILLNCKGQKRGKKGAKRGKSFARMIPKENRKNLVFQGFCGDLHE